MGTRINVLLEHDLADFRDRESVLARLTAALPGALAVQEYWRSTDPHGEHEEPAVWQSDPVSPRQPGLRHYTGAGSLFLSVTAAAAMVHTGGRWRGFLSIEPLHRVHLAAFRQIARCLGSRRLAVFADSDEVYDLFWDGRTQAEGIELMERMWGPPQPCIEKIEPRVALAAERTVPLVWFLVDTQGPAEH